MNTGQGELRTPLLVASVATMLAFCWQFAIVHFAYSGNWTSLFYTGETRLAPTPEELDSEHIYRFPGVIGYDGEMYHLIAHDPLFHRNFAHFIDTPRMRYRRILVPGLAALLSFGRNQWVDPAYFSVILGFIFLGAFWLARWSLLHGKSAYWGLLFLATPATLMAIPLMIVDVSLAALTVAVFLYAEEKSPVKLFLVLACATLARETGMLVVIGWCAWLVLQRCWLSAAKYAAAILPAACWMVFVQSRFPPAGPVWLSPMPLYGLFQALLHPFEYPAGMKANVLVPLDRIALFGMLLALAFAFYDVARPSIRDHKTLIALMFAGLALFLGGGGVWPEVGSFGRNFTPLVFAIAMSGIASGNRWRFIPLMAIDPRIGVIYVSQAVRAIGSIAHFGTFAILWLNEYMQTGIACAAVGRLCRYSAGILLAICDGSSYL